MTKSELVETIAQKLPGVPRRELEAIVQSVFDQMSAALCRGGRIELRGFGSFSVKVRPPHQARNPRTGARVQVPERRDVSFLVGKELKERINPEGLPSAAPAPGLPEPAAPVLAFVPPAAPGTGALPAADLETLAAAPAAASSARVQESATKPAALAPGAAGHPVRL